MHKPARLTVAELRARRGEVVHTMLFVETVEEAAAAAAAGIDMLSIVEPLWTAEMRAAAGDCFVQVGLLWGEHHDTRDYMKAAHAAMRTGGDAVYCASRLETVRALAEEGIPVTGHLGLVPSKATWTGGFKAVGRTAATALAVLEAALRLEEAGAFAAEIEVVPDRVTAEIARRTSLVLLGMGAGAHANAQYLFAEDVLGCTRGHRPRHAATYADFAAEHARLQQMRQAAFAAFKADVDGGAYPAAAHAVTIPDAEYAAFLERAGPTGASGGRARPAGDRT